MFIFPTLFVSSADELKAIDTKEECRIISDEHLEHLLLASLGIAKPTSKPAYLCWDNLPALLILRTFKTSLVLSFPSTSPYYCH